MGTLLPKRGTAAPTFRPMSMAKRSPISATAKLLCKVTTHGVFDHATYRSRQKQAKTLRHMGRDSSALRSELSLGHFGTCADLSGQFGPTKLVPKCLGSEVSVIRFNLTLFRSSSKVRVIAHRSRLHVAGMKISLKWSSRP